MILWWRRAAIAVLTAVVLVVALGPGVAGAAEVSATQPGLLHHATAYDYDVDANDAQQAIAHRGASFRQEEARASDATPTTWRAGHAYDPTANLVAPQTTRPLAEIGPAGNPGAFPPLSASTQQLQHTFKHADDFGVTGNWNKANGQALRDALDSHVGAPGTSPFPGTYRGDPVVHHLDPQTRLNVIQTPSGELVSGWRLSPDQLRHVLENGKLGGG